MLRGASMSIWWNDYPFFFLLLCGMHLTWVNAVFNLCSTAGKEYPYGFREPLIFAIISNCDSKGFLPPKYSAILYTAFFLVTCYRYTKFMTILIQKLTAALEINFLTVTPPKTEKKGTEKESKEKVESKKTK